MKRFIAAAAAITALGVSGPAHATHLTGQQLLTGFTNIVLGSLNASAETEGTIFVGGNYSGAGNVNPDGLGNVDLGSGIVGTFIVGGNVNGNANLSSGNAVIGGAITGTVVNNGTGTVSSGVAGIPVAEVVTVMKDLSTDLAANNVDTAGGTANTGDPNNINFVSGAGDANQIQYFNIAGSVLQSGTFTGITAPAGVTTIINVSGTNVTLGVNANQQLDDVLFNFYEATSMTINVAFNYSILAPLANITQNGGGIFGTVVSRSLDQNAEIRPYDTHNNFNGQLPPEDNGPAPVPVPPALALMVAGIGGLALLGRRKAAA